MSSTLCGIGPRQTIALGGVVIAVHAHRAKLCNEESRTLVVTITKNPTSQPGTYEIDFIGKCSSILSCIPSDAESRTRFANFVLTAN
jgi:hypothetical protein